MITQLRSKPSSEDCDNDNDNDVYSMKFIHGLK